MNGKEVRIVDLLLQARAPLTSQTLSEQMEISSRTVKRIIWNIDEELRENGALIVSNKNGYEVQIINSEKFDDYWQNQRRLNDDMSLENGIILTIMKQLLLNKYCTQDDLVDISYVSRSTISKYVKNVKEILEKEKIRLGNRPHFGYFLIGSEADIRNYMVKLFFPDSDLNKADPELIKGCRDFSGFIQKLSGILSRYGYEINDRRTVSIMKYFIVVANRVGNKCYVESFSKNEHVAEENRQMIQEIHELMETYYSINLNQQEEIYLLYVAGDPGKQVEERNMDFFDKVVTEFLMEIKEVYQQNFLFDPVLRQGLVQHLHSCYSRMVINTVIDNPLINVIKTKYLEAYNYAVLCGNVLRERYGIEATEDSMGYIALHFAAAIERINALYRFKAVIVCESGFGMAELLKMTITNRIKNLDIVATVSSAELYQMDLYNIAIVITSVKLKQPIQRPVIFVDPLNLEDDIAKIESYLKDYINIPQYKNLFSSELFFSRLSLGSKQEVLQYLSDRLLEKELINKNNVREIFQREEVSSTEINRYVAIPHCIVESNAETMMAIATLDKPVAWGKKKVSIILLACIARKSTLNRKLFPLLYKLTMDSEKCEKLVTISSYEEFIDLLFSNLPVDYGD